MYSLGEIEVQCKKAARGVGLSWGFAQEVGLVARHLVECNLPGSEAVLRSLKSIDYKGVFNETEGIRSIEKLNSSTNGLFLGSFFLDRVLDFIGKDIYISEKIVGPLAVVGFLLRLKQEKYCFSVNWVDCTIRLDKYGFAVFGNNLNPEVVNGIRIEIFESNARALTIDLPEKRWPISNWDVLTEMANRTHVPTSEKSRLLGAGAGDNENE